MGLVRQIFIIWVCVGAFLRMDRALTDEETITWHDQTSFPCYTGYMIRAFRRCAIDHIDQPVQNKQTNWLSALHIIIAGHGVIRAHMSIQGYYVRTSSIECFLKREMFVSSQERSFCI